jgi:hypothetical protein
MNRPDRLRVAAAAAVVAIVARTASILLWPPDSDASHAKMLATASGHHTAWELATAAEVIAWLTAGFAVLAAMSLVRGRGWWLTRIGGWVYGTSLLALGFTGGAMNEVTGVLARQPGRDAMVSVQDHLHGPVLDAMVMLILFGELFMIVFAAGLARARLVGWWYPALSVVALAAYVVTSDSSSHPVVLAGFVPLGVSWSVLAPLLAGRIASAAPAFATARGSATV